MAKQDGRRRGRRAPLALIAAALGWLVAGALATPASAGTFVVRSCIDAGHRGWDSGAFFGAVSSRRMIVKRACDPHGPGLRGLITANRLSRRGVRRGEHATVIFFAPRGTILYRLTWSGQLRRADCRWTVELVAVQPRRRRPIAQAPAGRRCPRRRAQASGFPRRRTFQLGNTGALVQRAVCRGRRGCSRAGLNMVRTFSAQVYVADFLRPGVRLYRSGLLGGRWVRGAQAVGFNAGDNVGIHGARLLIGGRLLSRIARPCLYTRPRPCPNGPGTLRADTASVPDGRRWVAVDVVDAAGNPARATGIAYVDNTPPGRVEIRASNGSGWQRTNSFAASWTNPGEAHAPIVAAFSRLCGGANCRAARHAGRGIGRVGGITVPAPGAWTFRIWRQDAAGNASARLASDPVTFRYDPDPPQLGFEHQSISDPTRVSVRVNEPVSGLARGEIELRRQGTSTWHTLPVSRGSDWLVGRIDDSRLPAGVYQLRARAADRAGNEASTLRRLDGTPMVLRLPLRFSALMSAGIRQVRVIRKRVRRGQRRRVVRRRRVRVRPVARIRLGRRARVVGRLTNPDGQPLAAATIFVFSGAQPLGRSLLGTVMTDFRGRFSYIVRSTHNRQLQFLYLGTPHALPAVREVTVLTPAATSIRRSRRRARNGQSVRFWGRVKSLPVPPTGKLLEIQAHFRGRWRTFSTVRTNRRGRWRFRYRFGGTVGRVRYRFRAVLPVESGYPFVRGKSRTVTVTVRGR